MRSWNAHGHELFGPPKAAALDQDGFDPAQARLAEGRKLSFAFGPQRRDAAADGLDSQAEVIGNVLAAHRQIEAVAI